MPIHPSGAPIVDFDHHAREFVSEKDRIYADVLRTCPIAYTAAHEGYFVVSSYEDIEQIAKNAKVFSSENDTDGSGSGRRGILIPPNEVRMGFVEMDPPDLMQYRRSLSSWFAPAAVTKFLPRLTELVRDVIANAKAKGEFDVVDDLTNPVSSLTTLAMSGLPIDDWEFYADPLHEMVYKRTSDEFPAILDQVHAVIERIGELVAARRREPTDDLISRLIEFPINGEKMDDPSAVNMIFMVLGGGFDTTTAIMTNGVRYFAEHPAERAACAKDPELLATAIEELLRVYTPSPGAARTVTEPTVVDGVHLSVGDRVWLSWGAANRDSARFADPDKVNITRLENEHLAFGSGVHRCLGMALARAEVRVFFEELFRAMPEYTIDAERAVPYPSQGVVNSYSAMPARVAP